MASTASNPPVRLARFADAPRPAGPVGQAPYDLNRDVWSWPPNLRNRTHAIAPATTGQIAVAPACAIKSPSISTVTTTANPIMGASRLRPATIAADAQFRRLLIAPSRIPSLTHIAGANVNGCLTEAGPTTCLALGRVGSHPREAAGRQCRPGPTGAPPSGSTRCLNSEDNLIRLGSEFRELVQSPGNPGRRHLAFSRPH